MLLRLTAGTGGRRPAPGESAGLRRRVSRSRVCLFQRPPGPGYGSRSPDGGLLCVREVVRVGKGPSPHSVARCPDG